MESNQIGILLVIVIYLLGMIIIGAMFSKKNETANDFYLGGRRLGPFVTAMSAEASDMSSYLLMGIPGLAYISGIADAGWTAIGLAIGTYVNWLLVAKRIRVYTAVCKDSFTLPSFFSNRYRDNKNLLMLLASWSSSFSLSLIRVRDLQHAVNCFRVFSEWIIPWLWS